MVCILNLPILRATCFMKETLGGSKAACQVSKNPGVAAIGDMVRIIRHATSRRNPFKRGEPGVEAMWPELPGDDNLNDALYSTMKDALDHGQVAWPMPVEEWLAERKEILRTWPEERLWALKNLDASTVQMKHIIVATKEDGTFAFTKRNARQFSAVGGRRTL
jgi:hypothetical protein